MTILGWFNPSDEVDFRTFFSIESDASTISLVNVFLPPGSMNVTMAYMVDANAQNRSTITLSSAPGPGQWFHLGVVIQNNTVAIYINGQQTSTSDINSIFNPVGVSVNYIYYKLIFSDELYWLQKILALGRTKFPLGTSSLSAQWNGTIHFVKVYNQALSDVSA